MKSILIVDDDARLKQSFERLLTEEGYNVTAVGTGEDGVEAVKRDAPDLVVMDIRLPGINGLEAFKLMRGMHPRLPVIIMTAFGTTETAIEATKMGAFDYIMKPFDIPSILSLIKQAIEAGRLMRSKVELNVVPETESSDVIVGRSEPMRELYKAIGRVAPTDATVLVRGESGTGKELVARALYQHSERADKPFLVINCVAIPETLLESELFGYEKGAFTGATARRVGKVEQAGGGTVFLDEIGDMPLSIQAKILRLLQERSIERLGGREPIPVDVRIIAATNRDLEKNIGDGRFREDLYYRLKVVSLRLPPLRDRKDDIPLLCEHFLARFSREMGIENPGITVEAKTMVKELPWPGNVREMANTMKKALIFSRGYPVRPEDISQAVTGDPRNGAAKSEEAEKIIRDWVREAVAAGAGEDIFTSLSDRFGGIVVGEALNITGGNRSRAAKILGISRPTLQAKIEKYQIKIETSAKSD